MEYIILIKKISIKIYLCDLVRFLKNEYKYQAVFTKEKPNTYNNI